MEQVAEQEERSLFQKYRWVLVVVLVLGLYLVGHFTGLGSRFDELEEVRAWVQEAGPWGLLLFIGLFSLGELVHVPGIVFVVAAFLLYGQWEGFLAAFAGAMTSVTVTFVIIRTVGGQPLKRIRWQLIRRMLAHLDERPITTVFILRLVFWLAPILNYVLAMSRVRYRDYAIGSALGLAPWLALLAVLFEQLGLVEWVSRFW